MLFFPDEQSIRESKLLKSLNTIELELTFVFKSISILFEIIYSNFMYICLMHICLMHNVFSFVS